MLAAGADGGDGGGAQEEGRKGGCGGMKADGCVGGGGGQSRHQGGHGAVGRATEGYHEASEDHGLAGRHRDGAGMFPHTGTNLPAAQRGLRLKRHVR